MTRKFLKDTELQIHVMYQEPPNRIQNSFLMLIFNSLFSLSQCQSHLKTSRLSDIIGLSKLEKLLIWALHKAVWFCFPENLLLKSIAC